jgi:hypothetical protein
VFEKPQLGTQFLRSISLGQRHLLRERDFASGWRLGLFSPTRDKAVMGGGRVRSRHQFLLNDIESIFPGPLETGAGCDPPNSRGFPCEEPVGENDLTPLQGGLRPMRAFPALRPRG